MYGDKLTEDKDIDAFLKMQVDICKKNFEVSSSIINKLLKLSNV